MCRAQSLLLPHVQTNASVAHHSDNPLSLVAADSTKMVGLTELALFHAMGIVEIEERDFYFEISPADYQDEEANIWKHQGKIRKA